MFLYEKEQLKRSVCQICVAFGKYPVTSGKDIIHSFPNRRLLFLYIIYSIVDVPFRSSLSVSRISIPREDTTSSTSTTAAVPSRRWSFVCTGRTREHRAASRPPSRTCSSRSRRTCRSTAAASAPRTSRSRSVRFVQSTDSPYRTILFGRHIQTDASSNVLCRRKR